MSNFARQNMENKSMKRKDVLFRTMAELPLWDTPLKVTDSTVFLGSCFAERIGDRFSSYGLNTLCNPLGVVYNPASVLRQIESCFGIDVQSIPVFETRGEWHCWWAGTSVSAATADGCRETVHDLLSTLRCALAKARYLFVTLGTNVCYKLKDNGEVVTNCHRMPAGIFNEYRMSVEECTQCLNGIVDAVRSFNPGCNVVFTVSPYRYSKYTYHGSQISKAILLLAVDRMVNARPAQVGYFPAYEIVMDELRDYRFYDTDMLHPSAEAVDYIWQCLTECAMDERMRRYLVEYEPVRKGLSHRPSDAESEEYAAFRRKLDETSERIRREYFPDSCVGQHS